MHERVKQSGRAAVAAAPRNVAVPGSRLPALIGNRAFAARASTSPALSRGRGLGPVGAAQLAAGRLTSPPNAQQPAQDAVEAGAELTTPPAGATTTPAQPVIDASTRQQPSALQVKSAGSIAGSYGISQYWPVTNYWGTDTTLVQRALSSL